VPTKWHGDPVRVAHELWTANGWQDTADGMSAVTSLGRVNQLVNQRADRFLAPLELTFARYEVLVVLYFNPEPVSLSFVAGALQLHQATVTGLVTKLEKQGLMERRPHPTDRRSTLAAITRRGRGRTRTAIKRLNTGLFSELGLDNEQARTLVSLLATIRNSWDDLQEGDDDAGSTDMPLAQSPS
jgi:DNA-binding MarR family transcriptional regulator